MLAALVAGATLFCSVPQPSAAFELFGIHLWGKKKPEKTELIGEPKYYSVKVVAATGAPEAGIKIARGASALVSAGAKPASGSAGLLAKARNDYSLILAALYADGRYGGVISITIDGQEAASIHPGTEFPDRVAIVITIDCGPQYRFARAAVHELAPPVPDRKKRATLPQNIGYATGEVAKSGVILEAEKLAVEGWRRQGYAKARILGREVVADHATRRLEADIRVKQGQVAFLGGLAMRNISRNPRMDPAYVAWMTGLHQGQRYDPDMIDKANKRLARLEVFRAALIREGEVMAPDGTLPLDLTVQERKPRRVGAGAAYSTYDGAGFEAYWLHRNLFGHAERLRFDARISQIGGNHTKSYAPENYSYLLGATFMRPGVFTPDTDYIGSLRGEREVLRHYTSTGIYLHTGFSRIFTDELSGRLYLDLARVRTEDEHFGSRNFTMAGFLGGLLYDSRDDKMDAHHGFYGELVAEPFYEAEYHNLIARIVVEGRTYQVLDKREQFVLAGRVKVGSITGADASQVPSNMLFFAGGGSSVRGYGYRNIGVRAKNGDIIGGRSLVEASAELRVMTTHNIGVVGFMDAGLVGMDSSPDFHEKIKLGVGVGARYKTGLGPVRLDVAVPLNRAGGDPTVGLYVGIGQEF